jgi:hypothetical protein
MPAPQLQKLLATAVLVCGASGALAETGGWVDPPADLGRRTQAAAGQDRPAWTAPVEVSAPKATAALTGPSPAMGDARNAKGKDEPSRQAVRVPRSSSATDRSRTRAQRKSGIGYTLFGPPRRNAHIITTTHSR